MEKSLEVDIDIKYAKSVIDRCNLIYKDTNKKIKCLNKDMISRLYFIYFQFRNIFDSGLWL